MIIFLEALAMAIAYIFICIFIITLLHILLFIIYNLWYNICEWLSDIKWQISCKKEEKKRKESIKD